MKKILLIVAIALLPNLTFASFYTAGDIQKGIVSHERVEQGRPIDGDAQESAVAMGYIASIADDASEKRLLCLPSRATIGQLVAISKNYLKANPSTWTMSAATVIRFALVDAFPCGK
jgi:hypothetical protein